jgi:plastocyanin
MHWRGRRFASDSGARRCRLIRVSAVRIWTAGLLCTLAALVLASSAATAAGCPPIKNKPGAIPHLDYAGVQHLTYCSGPVAVKPGQNIIRLNSTDLFPSVPGYITRFDPELVRPDGSVPRVDVLHLHHAVWIVNGNPQFATGEEKTIVQLPKGFGWRSLPSDHWLLNDMIHDLVGRAATVYIVWRIDFVPDTAPAAAFMHTVRTRWMDVSGPQPPDGISRPIYPVFNALRGHGHGKRYTFPDEATGPDRALIGPNQSWTPDHPVTLIGTAGHLHPGGLEDSLRIRRGDRIRTLFHSRAHYYEPAGAVSWDVAMGATRPGWRVKVKPGDTLSVHSTYDTRRADWYEVMGILPVAVYDGTDVGGVGPFSDRLPQKGVLTHGHLNENRHHGGRPTDLPDPRLLKGIGAPIGPIGIEDYEYEQGDLDGTGNADRPPRVHPGQSLTFLNHDAEPAENTFHTITACRAPCNRSTGIAYPIANGPVTFDSGQLGFNYAGFGAPAAERDTWTTPEHLKPGTYTFFCRVHPFMRGSFRVVKRK